MTKRVLLSPENSDVVKYRTKYPFSDLARRTQTLLITGAADGVGIYLVQLAAIAGLYVLAAHKFS
jgi:NADPH:quinone reductase-like Zn-dependent oxidoreductase